ncbi:MAG TPA: hypothetical protein VEJ63_18155 [Planctomycetota bacterium]|nr:hypothetical protein [Planctomycetota bacterium]
MDASPHDVAPSPLPASSTAAWIVAAFGLLAVLLIVNRPVLQGTAIPPWDADQYSVSTYILRADFARAGRLVLWDPWSDGGAPTYIVPDDGMFSPPHLLFALIAGGTVWGYCAFWLAAWYAGGLGVLLLGRYLNTPAWGAFCVALGFLLCGFYTGQAQHIAFVFSFSALPFAIWRLDASLGERRWLPALEAGVLWGMGGLGGTPTMAIMSGCFLFCWALGRALTRPLPPPTRGAETTLPAQVEALRGRLLRAFKALAIILVAGVLVMAPAYLAYMYESRGYTDRAAALGKDVVCLENAYHPQALSTLASPFIAAVKHLNSFWSYTDVTMVSVYMGAIIPVLALSALLLNWRSRWNWWLVLLMLLGVGLAMSQSLPLRAWLYDVFPPSRFFRHSSTFRAYAMFCGAVLALQALAHLATLSPEKRSAAWRRIAIAALLVCGAAFYLYSRAMRMDHRGLDHTLAHRHFYVVWLGILGISAAAIFLARPRGPLVAAALVGLAIIDARWTAKLAEITLYSQDPSLISAWREITKQHDTTVQPKGLDREPRSPPWMDPTLCNKGVSLRMAVLRNYTPLKNRFHATPVAEVDALALGPQRFWFSNSAAELPLSDANYHAFVARAKELGTAPLLIHSPQAVLNMLPQGARDPLESEHLQKIAAAPPAQKLDTTLLKYALDELHFTVECPSDGWLLVTERWSRGWSATVNGAPAEVWGGNFVFRALPVKAGRNEVHFTYRPFGHPWLLLLSWGTIVATLAASVARRWNRR